MPNIKSAMKRVHTSQKARARNVAVKAEIKKIRRSILQPVAPANREAMEKSFREYCSTLDRAVKKGVIQKNTAIRRKTRAAARLKAVQ